jgi:23S rRNA pseudouridine1911/1915/1917 synthase
VSDSNFTQHFITVLPEHNELRLDKWLALQEPITSRSRAAQLISLGYVRIDGKIQKASAKVKSEMLVEIKIPDASDTDLVPLDLPLEVFFEDEDLVVVNKPAGLVVHPAAGHAQDTLVNILLHRVGNLSMGFGENRPGIVHRLDRDTSGLLVAAKNDFAHQALAAQFKAKTTHRIYWAIVSGVPKAPRGNCRSFLGRHPTLRKRRASVPERTGKLAITHYRVLQALPSKLSWLECKLETGRTHQIRVHLSELGHPILGDVVYGGKYKKALSRLGLHACELGFTHPRSNKELRFRAPWPPLLAEELAEKGFKDV